jgi:hypothetical protein
MMYRQTHLYYNYTHTVTYIYVLCLFFVLSNQLHGARMQAKFCRSFPRRLKV